MTRIVDGAVASEYTDGPNRCGYYTAGIDMPQLSWLGEPDTHYHSIQFHHKDKAVAEARRDYVLSKLSGAISVQGTRCITEIEAFPMW